MRRAPRWSTIATFAAALLSASATGTAHAADKSTREAEARFQEGLVRVKSHDFEAARLSFAQAYTVLHRPQILWNLALAEEKTGHLVEALQHFRGVADDVEAGVDHRTNAQRHVESLMALTGHIEVKAPPGAQVTVDGSIQLTAPLAAAVDVVPGRHVVDADVAVGARSIPVEVAQGEVARVSFVPPDASNATSVPGPAPSPVAPAPEGSGAPQDDRRASSDSSSARTITTVTLGGAAVVALGLGIYLGLQSRSEESTVNSFKGTYLNSYCTVSSTSVAATCSQWNNALQAQNRDAVASDVAYVAGGVLAVGALATWLFWPKATHGSGAWLLPEAGPTSAGLRAGGSF